MLVISVQPVEEGWSVCGDGVERDLVFSAGSAAEAAARCLGETLARDGQRVEIRLFLRDGGVAAKLICVADMKPRLRWQTAAEASTPA